MKRWLIPIIAAAMTAIAIIIAAIITMLGNKDVKSPVVERPERTLILMVAPDEWGKNLPQAVGKIIFKDSSEGKFEGIIEAEGLGENVPYMLSLNGKPSHPSNARLPQKKEEERYLDFETIKADPGGVLMGKFSASLEPGSYDVKIFLKDSRDWKIVMYNDDLKFNVK